MSGEEKPDGYVPPRVERAGHALIVARLDRRDYLHVHVTDDPDRAFGALVAVAEVVMQMPAIGDHPKALIAGFLHAVRMSQREGQAVLNDFMAALAAALDDEPMHPWQAVLSPPEAVDPPTEPEATRCRCGQPLPAAAQLCHACGRRAPSVQR